MTGPARRGYYAIDAGGGHTEVASADGASWAGPSVNPATSGLDTSEANLRQLLAWIGADATRRAYGTVCIWLATASAHRANLTAERDRLAAVARGCALSADVLLCNDVDALLLANNRPGGCAVAVSGTGSGFAASDGERVPVRIGGLEYLAGDEGGAFDLGLSGLRAAARAVDGRGAQTVLVEMLARESGRPFADLARDLAALAFPKRPVAMLAPVVTAAWQAGDAVAADLVRAAVHELVAGVRAARDRAGLRDGWTAIAMGGVFTGCGELFTLFARAVSERLGAQEVRLLGYPAVDLIRALNTWGGTVPGVPWADRIAATLTIGDREVGRV